MITKNAAKIELAVNNAKTANTELTRAVREQKSALRAYENLQKRIEGAQAALLETTSNVEAKLKAALAAQKQLDAADAKLAKAPKTGGKSRADQARAVKIEARTVNAGTVTARTVGKVANGTVKPTRAPAKKAAPKKAVAKPAAPKKAASKSKAGVTAQQKATAVKQPRVAKSATKTEKPAA